MRADIAAARKQADIVLVSFHWGAEGKITLREYQTRNSGTRRSTPAPRRYSATIRTSCKASSTTRDGVILYSLGNFTFGTYGPEAFRSAIAFLTFREEWRKDAPARSRDARNWPRCGCTAHMRNTDVVFQTSPLEGAAADKVVAELQALSKPLGTRPENRNGVAVLTFGTESRTAQH